MESVFVGLVVSWILFTVIWVLSVIQKDASLIDRVWGLAFICNGVGCALSVKSELNPWQYIVLLLLIIWGMRLSVHIHTRNIGHGEDSRYQDMRQGYESGFWWKSYFTIFMFQWLLAAVVSVPIFYLFVTAREAMSSLLLIGILFWMIGFFFEAVGDWQLKKFKDKPENKGKVLDSGLWGLTRHPNYFGDGMVWWGYFICALSAGGWWTFIGSVVMTIFLRKISGVDLLEKKLKDSKPGYREYVESTPAFIPKLWARKN